MKNRRAFTLIELLVVIAVIALLMSIVVPSLRKAKEVAKLIVCANNMNQTVKGVLAYAADNQGVLPPHPAERTNGTFSVANYLNYHQGVAGWAENEGTYYYLGGYLPLVDTFMCPLGRTRDYSELQYQYVNYKDSGEGTNCSYNLYWGGYSMAMLDGRQFTGPKGRGETKASAQLLLSDSIYNWPGVAEDWWLAHRPRRGSGLFKDYDRDPMYGNYCASFWIYVPAPGSIPSTGRLPTEMEELRMNAGYADGSVRRYTGQETMMSSDGYFYIPQTWR